jgi:hypothetical protein
MTSSGGDERSLPAHSSRVIRVGITGLRTLRKEAQVRAAIRRIVAQDIRVLFASGAGESEKPFAFRVLTCMADGTDQIVADEMLHLGNTTVTAVLPLEETEYREQVVDQATFDRILAASTETIRLQRVPLGEEIPGSTRQELTRRREELYDAASRYVVDHCDVLLAVWNRRGGEMESAWRREGEGTARAIEYALRLKRPVIVIDPEDPNPSSLSRPEV